MLLTKIHPDDRKFIYDRDDYKCLKCGEAAKSRLTIDHVVAISRGGRNHITNYQTLCRKCNGEKGSHYVDYRWHTEPQIDNIPLEIPVAVNRKISEPAPSGGYSGKSVRYVYPAVHKAIEVPESLTRLVKGFHD